MPELLEANSFDKAASSYDQEFTYSNIGRAQRERVWCFLNKYVNLDGRPLNILEINCGTGEDAISFAKMGHNVLATDVSNEMLAVAQSKSNEDKLRFQKLDLNAIDDFIPSQKFDLVFSNFGGLNCVTSANLVRISSWLSAHLESSGKFVAVIMPSFCMWETIYYFLKLNISKTFRRRNPTLANVNGAQIQTYYYSPQKFHQLFKEDLKLRQTRPVGLFIPPSYLEHFFSKHRRLLQLLIKLESTFSTLSWTAGLSDHYYISFEKR